MYSLEAIRDIAKRNITIVGVKHIDANFWGTELTLKGVTIAIQQEDLLYIEDITANINLDIDCSLAYPLLIHSKTKETVVDYANPITDDKNELPILLSYALIVFFHNHGSGQKQKTFLYGFEQTLKEEINSR